jgi:hypothetical protein
LIFDVLSGLMHAAAALGAAHDTTFIGLQFASVNINRQLQNLKQYELYYIKQ